MKPSLPKSLHLFSPRLVSFSWVLLSALLVSVATLKASESNSSQCENKYKTVQCVNGCDEVVAERTVKDYVPLEEVSCPTGSTAQACVIFNATLDYMHIGKDFTQKQGHSAACSSGGITTP